MENGISTEETRARFLQAMAEAATSVTLVTTAGPAGRFGVTVSAFASVSADPPMLLACINRRSPAAAAITANGGFCVNVLSAAQSYLADVFAGRSEHLRPYDFTCAEWERDEGGWRLNDSVASFACALDREVAAGTHQILIGRVLKTHRAEQSCTGSLVYSRRAYSIAQPIL
ncbi:flavin reductase family protein [Dongia deserti]|uniref:flavin reductase family protein n=1 Tax=Dongia deserti TaxID=2268030 RepID=UPI000E64741E|nr:flavin reductase family protein [Dongia deserti]